jgi:hypothetical protein
VNLFDHLTASEREAGARLHPAKEACISSEPLERGYPRAGEFLRYRDPGLSSAMSCRLLGS